MLVGLRVGMKAMKTLEEGVVGVLSGKCACRCRGIGEGSSVVTEKPMVVGE